jgi:hypothetical protein
VVRRNAALNRTEDLNVTAYEEATFSAIGNACSRCKALATDRKRSQD